MDKNKFIKSSLSGAIQLIYTASLSFISIPLFLNYLGKEIYGTFALLSILGSLNVFANLGFNYTLTKFIAEQGSRKESNFNIITTFCIQLIVFLPLTFVLFIFKGFILYSIFNIPQNLFRSADILFQCLLISNFVLILGQTFSSVLNALQKIYVVNIVQIIYSTIYWGLFIFALILGYGLEEIGYSVVISAISWFIIIAVACYKNWGRIEFAGFRKNVARIVKRQVLYTSKIFISGMLIFMFEPIAKLLVSNYIGINEVGYLDIGFKIRNLVYGFMNRLLDPFFAFFSNQNNIKSLKYLINDIEQKFTLLVIPVVMIVITVSNSFLNIWIHDVNDEILYSVIFITVSNLLFQITVGPNWIFLAAKNYVEKTILIQVVNVVVNIVVFFLTERYFHYYGILISICFSIFISFCISLYFQYKILGTYIIDNFSNFSKIVIIFILLSVVSALIKIFIISDLLLIIVLPLIIISISIILYRHLKLIMEDDINRYFVKGTKMYYLLNLIFVSANDGKD